MNLFSTRLATALLALGLSHAALVAATLPAGIVDPARVSVSGLSSGGFMAVQLHVAYSATFKSGAGVVAGGPWFCAENSLANALGRCMTDSGSIPVAELVATTRSRAASGAIDPLSNLAQSKLLLFSGTADTTVSPRSTQALRSYYQAFMPDTAIVVKDDIAAEHAMVTDDFGAACTSKGTPFINDCDFDLAGRILAQLHGPLQPRNAGALAGELSGFGQQPFGGGTHGLGAEGRVYVPRGCSASARCALHVVLHGCRQNADDIGDTLVRHAGYNRWADSNRIVVLYPQTGRGATNSCWDWWGYDSADYAVKAGPQMKAVKAMVDTLAGAAAAPAGGNPGEDPPPAAACVTASNWTHYLADRATLMFGAAYARGSGESLGWWFDTSSLRQVAPGRFESARCS